MGKTLSIFFTTINKQSKGPIPVSVKVGKNSNSQMSS